jgi:hypothetical protein
MVRYGALVLAALLAGCGAVAAPTPVGVHPMGLHVGNGTPLTVTLVVNGVVVAVVAPDAAGPDIDPAIVPQLPWSVEARSPSGRLLTAMTVSLDEAAQTNAAVHVIPMGRVDLSCGRLTIWAGELPPSGPVPPSPAGSPGDCAP